MVGRGSLEMVCFPECYKCNYKCNCIFSIATTDHNGTHVVSNSKCVAGCYTRGVVGFTKYRNVGHGCIIKNLLTTVLEHFTEHAINEY